MKKTIISFLIAGVLLIHLSSCKKVIAAIYGGSDINAPEFEMVIPQIYSVPVGEVYLGSYSFYFNLDSVVRSGTDGIFGANSVNSIKIKQVTIKVINPDQYDNLANIDSVRTTLQSTFNNTPVELFRIGFPTTYADSLNYTTSNSPELVSYMKGSLITYNFYGIIRSVTNKPIGITIDAILRGD